MTQVGLPRAQIRMATEAALIPVWFLAVYLLITAFTPTPSDLSVTIFKINLFIDYQTSAIGLINDYYTVSRFVVPPDSHFEHHRASAQVIAHSCCSWMTDTL